MVNVVTVVPENVINKRLGVVSELVTEKVIVTPPTTPIQAVFKSDTSVAMEL